MSESCSLPIMMTPEEFSDRYWEKQETVVDLLRAKANPNLEVDGKAIIELAIHNCEDIESLLRAKVDPDVRIRGRSLFEFETDWIPLLDAKANPNTRVGGQSLLDIAYGDKDIEHFVHLLKAKADLDNHYRWEPEYDPLRECIEDQLYTTEDTEVIQTLLESKATLDDHFVNDFVEKMILNEALKNVPKQQIGKRLAVLLTHLQPDPRCLSSAAYSGSLNCLKAILRHVPHTEERMFEALMATMLETEIIRGNDKGFFEKGLESIRLLLAHKADPDREGTTHHLRHLRGPPIHFAAEETNLDTVRILVEHKADIHQRHTRQILHVKTDGAFVGKFASVNAASYSRDKDILRYLLLQKADPDVPMIQQELEPICYAAIRGQRIMHEKHASCIRQFARAIMRASSPLPICGWFSYYVGLKKQIGSLLLGYYRPGGSEAAELSEYSTYL